MPSNTIKIRAKAAGGEITIKSLISHAMDTGLVKDKKTDKIIPAHYIQEVTCEHNGKVVMTAYWGRAVSKNPYLAFKIKNGKAGDSLKISWVDNKGEKDSNQVVVS
jgi:sulfur-oxidizing protein SoxZ